MDEDKVSRWASQYTAGSTLREIADGAGVSRQRVHQALKPLNLPVPARQTKPGNGKVKLSSPRMGGKVWSVYVMAAPSDGSMTYFKIGISSDVIGRYGSVQTGCPLRLTTIWAITTFNNGAAQDLERKLHALLAKYRTCGEWFGMNTQDPGHKTAMNEAFAFAVKACSQMAPMKWRKMDISEIRTLVKQANREALARKTLDGKDVWGRWRASVDNWPE